MAKRTTKKAATPQESPSFSQRLAMLRAEQRRQQETAERELATGYLREVRRNLETHISASKDEALKELWRESKRLTKLVEGDGGGNGSQAQRGGGGGGERRTRRTAEQQKADAEKTLSAIKKAGGEGISAADLQAAAESGGFQKASPDEIKKLLGAKVSSSGRGPGAKYVAE